MTQLALYEAQLVDMPQVFFPCATDAEGQTLYEKMVEGKLLLGKAVVTSWERRPFTG